jgi:hypothetical protein
VPGDFGGSAWDGTGDTEDGGTEKRTGAAAVRGMHTASLIPYLKDLLFNFVVFSQKQAYNIFDKEI